MGKTNPAWILTKCILHMCEASVSSADPAGCGWWPARGVSAYSALPSPLWRSLPEAEGGGPCCCPSGVAPRGLPSSSISPLGSAPGSSEPGALLCTRPLLCLFLSRWVWGGGQPHPSPHGHLPCPFPCPMPSATRKPAPISAPGQGQAGHGWMSGRGIGSVRPTPVPAEQSHGFRYSPPVLFLFQPRFHPASGLHGSWGPCWSQHSAREPGHGNCTPTTSYLTGVLFRDALGQRVQILPQSRN